MVPFAVGAGWALAMPPPDLLITACLLLYAAQMTPPRYGRHWWDGACSGVLGGIAYLAKAYALPVVGTHLVLIGVVNVITRRNRPRPAASPACPDESA